MKKEDLRKVSAVEDHRRLFKTLRYVYPVISRRSGGLSLGVNLNPLRHCTFNCVYCEVDRSEPLPFETKDERIDLNLLEQELKSLIEQSQSGKLAEYPRFSDAPELTRVIKDIAFSGNGEPTLSPSFGEAVERVGKIWHQLSQKPKPKTVLITNASCLHLSGVLEAIKRMHQFNGEAWVKLDAGTEEYYYKMNVSKVSFDRILGNILLVAENLPIYIQSLFLKFNGTDISETELELYCERLNEILSKGGVIRGVQAYTIARPAYGPGADLLSGLSALELQKLAEVIQSRTGLSVETYA